MKTRILVGLSISGAVMLFAALASGAPPRVHAAEAVALAIGFTIPSLWIRRARDVVNRWRIVLPAVFLGALAWDLGASATISKVEAFSSPAIYVVLPVGAGLLLAIHGFVVSVVTKDRLPPVSPSNPPLQADEHLGRSAPSVARR